jgi:hypothetical protein
MQQQGQAVNAGTWPYGGATAGFFSGPSVNDTNTNNVMSTFTDKNGFTYVGGLNTNGGGGTAYSSIKIFDPSGNLIRTIKIGGQTDSSVGVLVDSQGYIYAFVRNIIAKYTFGGTFIAGNSFSSAQTYQFYFQKVYIDASDNLYATFVYITNVTYSYLEKLAIAKFDTSLNLTWKAIFNSTYSSGHTNSIYTDIATDSAGNVYGVTTDSDSSYNRAGLIFKLNSSGTLQSTLRFTGTGSNGQCSSIAIDGSDNVYVSGYDSTAAKSFIAMYNTSLVQQWSYNYFGTNVALNLIRNPSNTNSIVGMVKSVAALTYNLTQSVVFCLDSTGAMSWANSFNSPLIGAIIGNAGYGSGIYQNNFGLSSSTSVFPVSFQVASPFSFGTLSFDGKNSVVSSVNNWGTTYPLVYAAASFSSATQAEATSSVTMTVFTQGTITTTTTTQTGSSLTTSYPSSIWSNTANGYGSAIFTGPGTYTWICPPGITSVSALAVGPGGNGIVNGAGGAGGGLGYKNNYSVTPGNSYTVVVGQNGVSDSYFVSSATVKGGFGTTSTGGTYAGDGGGNGGATSSGGGGGAGGYAGAGGAGASTGNAGSGGGGGGGSVIAGSGFGAGGGGVGIYGQGTNGTGGSSGNGGVGGSGGVRGTAATSVYCSCAGVYVGTLGSGGAFGGGGGGAGNPSASRGYPAAGVVRLVWPGNTRTFPTTNVSTP